LETEEGFVELLPPQQTTISKHYHEEQLALAIATTAGMFDVFQGKTKSPSILFDKKVIQEFVGQHVKGNKRYVIFFKGEEGTSWFNENTNEVYKDILCI
jgi:hypothetical protein